VELFGLSGMAHLQPLALERVVRMFADFVAVELKVGDRVNVYHNYYRLASDPGMSSSRSEFVFDLTKYEGKLRMISFCRYATHIKMRGGFVQNHGNLRPASIVVVNGFDDTLLSIEGMTEKELIENLKSNVGLFCSASSTESDPPSWINLLEQMVLSVQSFHIDESDRFRKKTRELLLGILHEFQLASK
jgi:hypothetical protein